MWGQGPTLYKHNYSDFTVSKNVAVEPNTVAISALTFKRSNHYRLDLIHKLGLFSSTTRPDHIFIHNLARSHTHLARSHQHSARSYPHSARSHPHAARFHPQTRLFFIHNLA
jgi:hypothetical protein